MDTSFLRAFVLCPLLGAEFDPQWLSQTHLLGRTPAQVRTLFPEAKPVDQPDHIYSGAVGQLAVSDLEVGGVPVTARFYFLRGELSQLELAGPRDLAPESARQALGALQQNMQACYGQGTDETYQDEITRRQSTLWLLGATRVELLHLQLGRADPVLKIIYRRPQKDPGPPPGPRLKPIGS